jgi:predicted DNA-binding protein with PD1-like motif
VRYCEANQGRIFIIRLEDGEVLHEQVERFAADMHIQAASVICLGGADEKSRLITGPKAGRASQITPNEVILKGVYEVTGVGTVFPNKQGIPVLHMHLACGRRSETVTGCVRRGVKVWHVMEIILTELVNHQASRQLDPVTGFDLLVP